MLLGEFNHTIDEKSRLIVPAKFRDDLGSTFIVTKGFDICLSVFSISEWQNFETKLKTLPLSNENARKFVRYFTAGATECQVDKQGRILIPQNLKDYAGLKKEIVFTGVSTRAEIWDKEKWEKYTSEDSIDLNEIASHMSEFGIWYRFTKDKIVNQRQKIIYRRC